jgi:hypothetical protein
MAEGRAEVTSLTQPTLEDHPPGLEERSGMTAKVELLPTARKFIPNASKSLMCVLFR